MRKEHGGKVFHEKFYLKHVAVRQKKNYANRSLHLFQFNFVDCFSIGGFSYFRLD